MPLAPRGLVQLAAIPERHRDEHRDQHQGKQAEPWLDPEHHRDGEYRRRQVAEDERGGLHMQADEDLHIVDQPEHELAAAVRAADRRWQRLQVHEHTVPQLEVDLLGHPRVQYLLPRRRRGADRGDQDVRRCEREREALRGEPGVERGQLPRQRLVSDDAVDQELQRPRREDGRPGSDEREEGREGEGPAVRPQIPAEGPAQPRHDPPLHAATTGRKSCARRVASRSPSKRSRTTASASRPRRRARSGSRCSRTMASASAGGSSGGTRSPLTPSTTSSGIPETPVVTTGRPHAIASTSTFGMPSRSPSSATRQGRQKTVARRYSSSSAACPRGPARRTASVMPRAAIRRRTSAPCALLSPTMVALTATPCARRSAQASTRTSKPFFGTRRPTPSARIDGPADGRPFRASASRRARSAFSPWYTQCTGTPPAIRARWRRFVSVQVTAKRAAATLRRRRPPGLSEGW